MNSISEMSIFESSFATNELPFHLDGGVNIRDSPLSFLSEKYTHKAIMAPIHNTESIIQLLSIIKMILLSKRVNREKVGKENKYLSQIFFDLCDSHIKMSVIHIGNHRNIIKMSIPSKVPGPARAHPIST
jgi:hypothetical protein